MEAQNTGMGSLLSPGELPNLGIELGSPALQENFLYQPSYQGSPSGTYQAHKKGIKKIDEAYLLLSLY